MKAIDRKHIIGFEGHIRGGLCEGDCCLDKIRECGAKCPVNNLMSLFASMANMIALASVVGVGEFTDEAKKEVPYASYKIIMENGDPSVFDICKIEDIDPY